MKKQFLTVAVAALALAGCSKNETVEVASNRAIGFESFVGKATRAVTDLNEGTNFNKFFVYGSYENGGSYVSVYDGEYVSKGAEGWTNEKTQYWVDGKAYKFAAYSNGNETVDGVTFADNGSLTIPNYTVDTKDLIAVTSVSATGKKTGNDAVELQFKHLLSKVKFTFSTTYNADLTVTVSNLKFNAVNAGAWNGTWTPSEDTKADKTYGNVTVTSTGAASEECYVLPQSNKTLVASFTVTVRDAGNNIIATKDFTNVALASGNGDTWTSGFAYNYTATINPKNVDPDGSQSEPIVFNPSVGGWEDGIVNDDDILNE